ncbi:hypothetical protein I6B53_10230 [Schaalia sp. 19OD2882]|uniref:hypothetical protein n=1 Tax=Schaalia sp. 19OD2882 TaxID=2794089 RepID=UPI001C1E8EC3|nr:hypothetical protein [Schaalia sp. 19OD2882]QWW19443.1 hypothetical protein I6B53_10230 [Schaalia sp. 19OD2882]
MMLRYMYHVATLRQELEFVSFHLKKHLEHRRQSDRLESVVNSLVVPVDSKSLRRIGREIHAALGWGYSSVDQVYITRNNGQIDHAASDAYQEYVEDIARFARLAKRPWSRLTVRLVP